MFALMGQSSFEKGSERDIFQLIYFLNLKNMKKLLLIILSFIFFWGFIWASTSKNDVISRMYQNWLTKFDNPTDFMESKSLRRDEASKFFVQYSKDLLNKTTDETKAECNTLSDLNKWWSDLSETMKDSCKLWLFQWYKGKFMPTQTLTKWQAITVLIRMIDGKKDETQWHFAQKYYERALELWILDWVTLSSKTFDYLITRGDMARLLYNAWNIGKNTTSNNNGLSTVCINDVCTSGTSITCKGSVCTSTNWTTTNWTTTNNNKPDLIIDGLLIMDFSNMNETFKIQYTIKNIWNWAANYDWKNNVIINCYSSDGKKLTYDMDYILNSTNNTIGAWWKKTWIIYTNVTYWNMPSNFNCIIDESNILEESNENNNIWHIYEFSA